MAGKNKLPDEIPYNKFKYYTAAEWREHCLEYKRTTTPAERMARLAMGWIWKGNRWVRAEQMATT